MSISLRLSLAPRITPGAPRSSLRAIIGGLHITTPLTIRDTIRQLEPIKLVLQFHAGTCSGSCEVNMASDGKASFSGNVHNRGTFVARFALFVHLNVRETGLIILERQGRAGGTLGLESRDDSWDESTTDALIADHWISVKTASASVGTEFSIDSGAFEALEAAFAAGSGFFLFKL